MGIDKYLLKVPDTFLSIDILAKFFQHLFFGRGFGDQATTVELLVFSFLWYGGCRGPY
jgi:hypothetical protein